MPMANLCRIFVLKKYGGAFRKGTHGNTLFTCRTNRKASEKDSAPGNLIPVSTAFLLYPKKPFSGEERISTPLPVWKGSTITEISPICRSEAHTSELQSLMRTSYAVFCLQKKHNSTHGKHTSNI